MIVKNRLLVISILISILVGIKLLRLLPVPGISIFWNLHIYVFAIVGVLSFMHINRFLRNNLDKLFLLLILSVSFLVIFRNIDGLIINIVTFILPLLSYYLFRNIYLNYHDLYKLFYILSIFLIILFFLDFFSNNILELHIIDYSRFHEESSSRGRVVASMSDFKTHPLFIDKWLRVGGVTFAPQPTAVLYASFSIFHLYIYNKTKSIRQLSVFFIYLVILILYNSGTSLIVLFSLIILIRRNRFLNLVLVISSIPILTILLIFQYGSLQSALETFTYIFNGIYNIYLIHLINMDEFFLSSLLLGTGFSDVNNTIIFNFEIDYINLIFQLGLINIAVLIVILVQTRRYFISLLNDGIDLMPFYYLMVGIIIGSMHYQSIFKYPNSMLLFGIIGIVSRFFINNKRLKIETE